jgi:diketogulonate reductase-like aldo/keto reductase
VALRFLLHRPGVFVIPKASSPEHVEENAGAGAIDLSESEIRQIGAAFPIGKKPRHLPML